MRPWVAASTITASDTEVRQDFGAKGVLAFRWDEIQAVEFWLTRRRFRPDDVLIVLRPGDPKQGMLIPYDRTPLDFLAFLVEHLPGFDADGFTKVLAFPRLNRLAGRWIYWRRDAPRSPGESALH
jgi:hypothetical protein